MDFNGSFLTRVRDLVGANPIILVVTKVIGHVSRRSLSVVIKCKITYVLKSLL